MKRYKKRPTSGLKVAEDFVPIAELKAHLSERIRELRERGRPYVVTQNGKAAAVLLAPDAYDRMTTQVRFIESVKAGLEDEAAGRVISDEELTQHLDKHLWATRKSKKAEALEQPQPRNQQGAKKRENNS